MRRFDFTVFILTLLLFLFFSIYTYVRGIEYPSDLRPARREAASGSQGHEVKSASNPCLSTYPKGTNTTDLDCGNSFDPSLNEVQANVDFAEKLVNDALLDNRKGLALSNLIQQKKECFDPKTTARPHPQNCIAIARAYPTAIKELGILAKGGDMESEYFVAQLITDSIFNSFPTDTATLSFLDNKIKVDGPGWIDQALALANDSANQGYGPAIAMRKKFGALRP